MCKPEAKTAGAANDTTSPGAASSGERVGVGIGEYLGLKGPEHTRFVNMREKRSEYPAYWQGRHIVKSETPFATLGGLL